MPTKAQQVKVHARCKPDFTISERLITINAVVPKKVDKMALFSAFFRTAEKRPSEQLFFFISLKRKSDLCKTCDLLS